MARRLHFRIALGLAGLLAGRAIGADWPEWRGPERQAIWSESGLRPTFPPSGLKFTWRAPVGRGWSSPVVARKRVYLTDLMVDRPKATERVLCLDEDTGRVRWSHTYPVTLPDWAFDPNAGGPRATPLVRDGIVFTLGALGHLFCLDATRGTVLWERNLARDYQLEPFSGITASPLLEGGLLLLQISGRPAASVVALDKKTGREVWRALEDGFTYSTPAVLEAGGRRQLIVWTQPAVTSLDPATGRTWWRELVQSPGDLAVATPIASGNRLYAGGLMFQLDPDRPAASVRWPENRVATRRLWSNTSTPLFLGDHLYSARTTGELICVEAATGRVRWETNSLTSLKNGASLHLTRHQDSVLIFTDQGNLIRARLSPAGYVELGRAHLLEPTHSFNGRKVAWPPPAYANRAVLARSDTELIRADLGEPAGND